MWAYSSLTAYLWPGCNTRPNRNRRPVVCRAVCKLAAGLLLFLSLTFPSSHVHASPTAKPLIRVMTYNIHHGEGTDGKVDLERIAEVIRQQRADIITLQEVDRGVARTARRDLVAELAALTGMNYAFGKNLDYQGGDYGNAVLTRFPIVKQQNLHYKMLRPGEQRGLLQVVLKLGGRQFLLLNTHLDYRRDDAERLSNLDEIRRIPEQYKGLPVILCGDFNDTPGSATHLRAAESFIDTWERVGKGDGFSYSSTQPQKRIDYVFVSKGRRLTPLKAWVVESKASDHLPVVVEFDLRD